MPVVNCKSQMKLTNIEQCAICKGIKCNNGNCDCAITLFNKIIFCSQSFFRSLIVYNS